ncbi:hypothetical protein MCEMSHM24_03790 [Comamonadaceae bacterium]
MDKFFVGLVLWGVAFLAESIEISSTYTPRASPAGGMVSELRVDGQHLYLKSDTYELIRVNKESLFAGSPQSEAISSKEWDAVPFKSELEELAEDAGGARSGFEFRVWQIGRSRVAVRPGYCAEGLQESHALRINRKAVDTGIPNCMALSEPTYLDGKLWFGTSNPGEYAEGPSVGILIFDVASQRRVARISKNLVGQSSGHMAADPHLQGVWVINDKAIHFFDRNFDRKAIAFYSEQFDEQALHWSSIRIGSKQEKHNAFAVAARLIMTSGKKDGEYDDAFFKRMADHRWRTVEGISIYQKKVARLSPKARSEFWIEYDSFERAYFPWWGKKPMSPQWGGREFREARNLIHCLYLDAVQPKWSAETLVTHISKAVDNLNWADTQLYTLKCDGR